MTGIIDYDRPFVTDYQQDIMDSPARFTVCEASTKVGKTASHIIWLFEQALNGQEGQNFWWVAPIFKQAEIAFNRLRIQISDPTFAKANLSDLTLTLPTGAIIAFKSGDNPDSLYGEDVYGAVADEYTRMKEDAWTALRSTLTATKGKCKFIGNVRGRGWGYKLAQRAKNGNDPNYEYFKITAWDAVDAGILDRDEVLQAKRDLPDHVFKELYEAEPSDDGGNPFGIQYLAASKMPHMAAGPAICYGIDLAETSDFTVEIGLNAAGEVCHFERYQKDWPTTKSQIISLPDVPMAVDQTGVGKPVVEDAQKVKRNLEGFTFTSNSKQQIIEGLAAAIKQGQTKFPAGGVLDDELHSFEYKYTRTGVKYCVSLDTMILTSDLRWVTAETLKKDDQIIGFEEFPTSGNKTRNYCHSQVISHEIIEKPCYKITLENDDELISSEDHLWLVDTGNVTPGGGKCSWRRTDQLRAIHATSKSPRDSPNRLVKLMTPWSEIKTYEAGYLAGIFDGEGSLNQTQRKDHKGVNLRVSFAQRQNSAFYFAIRCLSDLGFKYSLCGGSGTYKDVFSANITGKRNEILRFLGSIRPQRLLSQFKPDALGVMEKEASVAIRGIEFIGTAKVVAMQTTSKTFIANGYASHNCAPEGLHDDCVCAYALAWYKFRYRPAPIESKATRPQMNPGMFSGGGGRRSW